MAKYPRTLHLPNSPGGTHDDKRHANWDVFQPKCMIVTEKLDGSNVCLTPSDMFARSHSGPPTHASFDWLKAKYNGSLKWKIQDLRSQWNVIELFCEYVYAVHSIEYHSLPSYIFLIGCRMDDFWIGWKETENVARHLEIPTVPVIAYPPTLLNGASVHGGYDKVTQRYFDKPGYFGEKEGIVIRNYYGFEDSEFSNNVGKYVRSNHVQTDEHWTNQEIRVQKLAAR